MQCDDVSQALPEIVDGAATADLALRRHVDTCLRCQAELAQYRRVLRAMHQLRTEVLEPTPGLLADILAKVEEAGSAAPSVPSSRSGASPMPVPSPPPPPPVPPEP